ncbi:MAG: 1-deoxy-D-xylulose-5-phosphate reductoisomerase [Paludibacteraceae bacterium]|jgi:1-deoxy-D-xylulose-5-phosphate reductoisomerase|nr:1-deoxy-D-xylulose-5-phosphate reductoisomerase [Paludibacteraceae bacterium]
MKKKIVILGSTGSIGTQTIDVVASNPDKFELFGITAHSNSELLISQARKYKPNFVIVTKDECYPIVKEALSNEDIKVFAGIDSVCDLVSMPSVDIVVTAMVGYAGLKPTISAVKAGKTIALANKETLVVAGELIKDLALKHHSPILPVDSEHSAIFQCLAGEITNPIEKIILTASGGPFRKHSLEELKHVTKADALKHPNWDMGAKITIDSASMMNKGFEVIEAKWLFDLNIDQIDVLVHPQSIVHSMVQFKDGSVKAQLGLPDMRLPIAYALSYPNRLENNYERLDFLKFNQLTFEKPDIERFRNLGFAFEAMKQGGNMPCILNAANEIAVYGFLHDKISFLGMSDLIEWAMTNTDFIASPTYEDYVATDSLVRKITSEKIGL